MSVMNPNIDSLLERTDHDKYLRCTIASKRARDINDMIRGQRDRAVALQSVDELSKIAGRKPLSLALEEIDRGEVAYDTDSLAEE